MSRRRWAAWVILDRDETFYRVSLADPEAVPELARLLVLGWIAVPVEISEVLWESG